MAPVAINISETVAGHVKALFVLEPRGSIEAKHERAYEMYFLNRLRHETSCDAVSYLASEDLFAKYDRLSGVGSAPTKGLSGATS
jgi:hypothetical protein